MDRPAGRFIVIEGADGSGKATQSNLLAQRLTAAGYDVHVMKFPRYDQPSSHFVRSYLNGDYGPAAKISPYAASVFYALDRFEAAPEIRKALADGKVVISDRYVGANMGHQGAKFDDEGEQRGFFVWDDSFEFELLGIPRPDITLFLRVPPAVSLKLIKQRAAQTGAKLDEHEADKDHLAKAAKTYDTLCKLFPKDYLAVECAEDGRLMNVELINNKLWEQVRQILPPPAHKGRPAVVKLRELSPVASPSDTAPTNRVSLLELLESLSQSHGRIDFQIPKNFNADSDFQMPKGLDSTLAKNYKDGFKRLANLRQQIRKAILKHLQTERPKDPPDNLQALADAAVTPLMPLAALAEVAHLLPSPETIAPSSARQLAQEQLAATIADSGQELRLLSYSPRAEFNLLADGLYPYTDLSRQEILAGIDSWSYDRKERALLTIIADAKQEVLSELKYRFDGLLSGSLILEAYRSGLINRLRIQTPSVRFGYGLPRIIELAGQEDKYLQAFDLSLSLFSELQAAGREAQAPLVVLLGHKLRCQFDLDVQKLHFSRHHTPEYRELISTLRDKTAEVHPLIVHKLTEQPPATKKPGNRGRRHRRQETKGL